MTPPMPACMTPDELALWNEAAAYLRNWGGRATLDPCADCTVAFSDEMRALGRCNGIPGESRPVPYELTPPEKRRESNRRCQQRYRERHQDKIRERRRAYFEARYRASNQAAGAVS